MVFMKEFCLMSIPLSLAHHFCGYGPCHTQSPQMPAHLVTDVCVSPPLREGCSTAIWSPVRGGWTVRGARGQREGCLQEAGTCSLSAQKVFGMGLIWFPPPQGRCVTVVPIFHTGKSGSRKFGELAESISLESQELTFGYLSLL